MKPKKILVVASMGGHWVQLMRLRPAFRNMSCSYVSTDPNLKVDVPGCSFWVVKDASMSKKLDLLLMGLQVLWIVLRVRPNVVLSTGAAPGFFALLIGKVLGAKTIWVDSIANSEELSLAGSKVKPWATHWLTQWKHLEKPNGPKYFGAVI